MKKKFILGCILVSVIFISYGCGESNGGSSFPMDKAYWTPDDYHNAYGELYNLNSSQSELPNLDNPNTAPIFKKLTDTNNFTVVTNDNQLGLTHRTTFANEMFSAYKDLTRSYTSLDRQDKYKYPVELVQILQFGLCLQIPYIVLGNEKITKEADNPNAPEITSVIKSNGQVLISNYNLYLDYINFEDRFNVKALVKFSEGIRDYFPRLINSVVPNGDYAAMSERIDNMLKKAKNSSIIHELQQIKDLLKTREIKV